MSEAEQVGTETMTPVPADSSKATAATSTPVAKATENSTEKPLEQSSEKSSANPKPSNKSGKIAVILVRGLVGVRGTVRDTLLLMKLSRKNHCVILNNNPSTLGMLKKVKDYVTWGEVSEETIKQLVEKRGEVEERLQDSKKKYTYKSFQHGSKNYKRVFRLSPPRKGFNRKGIKISFKAGGNLGNRGAKINDLLQKMI